MDNTPKGRVGKQAVKVLPNNSNMLWFDAICQQALSAQMIAKMYALVSDHTNENLAKQLLDANTLGGALFNLYLFPEVITIMIRKGNIFAEGRPLERFLSILNLY